MGDVNVSVIGGGLIGGSLALALKRRRPDARIVLLDRPQRLPAIRDAGIGDHVGTIQEAARYLPESSLVVLATPVEVILTLLSEIAPHLRPGTLVTDVGSTKSRIVQTAQTVLPEQVNFIGGHPIAGAERSGIEAADPLLFNERIYLLCPSPSTPPEALLTLIDVVEDLLAVPVTIEPEEHDRILAAISHLPQLLAIALMRTALDMDKTHGLLETLAGSGFLDLTRIAASDYNVWGAILNTNEKGLAVAFDHFQQSLETVQQAFGEGDLGDMWSEVAQRRRKMSLNGLPRPRQPDLRKLIDRYDEQILKALGNRMRIVKRIGRLKVDQTAPVHDPDRERRLLAKRREWARALDLPPELVEALFENIMQASKKIQSDLT